MNRSVFAVFLLAVCQQVAGAQPAPGSWELSLASTLGATSRHREVKGEESTPPFGFSFFLPAG